MEQTSKQQCATSQLTSVNNNSTNNNSPAFNSHKVSNEWNQQRAEFLDVPVEVLNSKKTFDLIRLLRKNRKERLAAEAAEKEAANQPQDAAEEEAIEAQTPLTITYTPNNATMNTKTSLSEKANGRQYYNGFRIKNAPLGSDSSLASTAATSAPSTPRTVGDEESSAESSAEETVVEATITARDLIRIVPDIILARELFQPYTLQKAVNLNDVMRLATEEWADIEMDNGASLKAYHEEKHADLIDDSDVEEEEEFDSDDEW